MNSIVIDQKFVEDMATVKPHKENGVTAVTFPDHGRKFNGDEKHDAALLQDKIEHYKKQAIMLSDIGDTNPLYSPKAKAAMEKIDVRYDAETRTMTLSIRDEKLAESILQGAKKEHAMIQALNKFHDEKYRPAQSLPGGLPVTPHVAQPDSAKIPPRN